MTSGHIHIRSAEDLPVYPDVEHEILPMGFDPVKADIRGTFVGPLSVYIERFDSPLWFREVQCTGKLYFGLFVPGDDRLRFNTTTFDACTLVSWHGLERCESDYIVRTGTRNYMIGMPLDLARHRGWVIPAPETLSVKRDRALVFARQIETLFGQLPVDTTGRCDGHANALLDALDQATGNALYRNATSRQSRTASVVHGRLVRDALAFLNNCGSDENVTGTDLSAAIGVPLRTLYAAFESRLGIGPTQLQTTQRLYQLRRRLRAAAPDNASVSRLMHDSGFNHLGRTSGLYRRHFGETPATTLRRST